MEVIDSVTKATRLTVVLKRASPDTEPLDNEMPCFVQGYLLNGTSHLDQKFFLLAN